MFSEGIMAFFRAMAINQLMGEKIVASKVADPSTLTNTEKQAIIDNATDVEKEAAKSSITEIEIAQRIGTFETSILPEEDCCTVFSPKKPVTKPKLDRIERSENALDVEKLIQDAIDNIEVEDIEF